MTNREHINSLDSYSFACLLCTDLSNTPWDEYAFSRANMLSSNYSYEQAVAEWMDMKYNGEQKPRKKWIRNYYSNLDEIDYECPYCRKESGYRYNYCPNCGKEIDMNN